MTVLRAFIAVEIPQPIKTKITTQTLELRQQVGHSVRWSDAENIHITLKFLGDVSREQVDVISSALKSQVKEYTLFELTLDGLGVFPNLRHPRIVWVGLNDPKRQLTRLQQGLEGAIVSLGHAPETKPFSPHLTIGRVREGLSEQEIFRLQNALRGAQLNFQTGFAVKAVSLMRSELKPAGPIYTCLSTAALGG